jgi:NADH:ubiquinone oxidoreductase subunit C
VTASPSETTEHPDDAPDPLLEYAESVAAAVGGTGEAGHGTAKVRVPADSWTDALRTARDELGLVFFSWLSAIDWTNDVQVGDPLQEETDERFEVVCTVADLSEGRRVTFSTDIPKDGAVVSSLVGVYAGADWHEREAHEMFGIVFDGHPNLENLYLPEGFLGHPLRKSFALLSREVKPWPGTVDVEDMPPKDEESDGASASTENPEA